MSEVRTGISRNILRRSRGFVEDNPVAKLMYYVDCVSFLFELQQTCELLKITNFQAYKGLQKEDVELLIEVALLFEPTKLLEKCIFVEPQEVQDSQDYMNRFEESSILSYLPDQGPTSILIEGERYHISRVMFCCLAWIEQYFILPFKELKTNQDKSVKPRNPACSRRPNECCSVM